MEKQVCLYRVLLKKKTKKNAKTHVWDSSYSLWIATSSCTVRCLKWLIVLLLYSRVTGNRNVPWIHRVFLLWKSPVTEYALPLDLERSWSSWSWSFFMLFSPIFPWLVFLLKYSFIFFLYLMKYWHLWSLNIVLPLNLLGRYCVHVLK